MATEADLIQKFKDLNIPVGADFEELIHEAFIGANLVDQVNSKADDSKVVHNTGAEEISGQKTFDVAPIDRNTGNPYITKDGVPAVPSTLADTTKLSNFTAGLQSNGTAVVTSTDLSTGLATKADTSAIDPSVMIKNTLTANDDVLALGPGTYYTWGVTPNNFPALAPWSTVVVKTVNNQPMDGKNVTITDTNASQLVNTYSGTASTGKWSGWRVSNSATMASKSDVTTAISTATANMADVSKANTFSKQQIFSTNPTNGTQVYPIYATVGTDADATTLIASLQSSGFSGMIGVPES